MKIGELARRSGVPVRMLRHYEAMGLLAPGRSAAGYRVFGPADAARVQRIVTLNRAGIPLREVRAVLDCALPDGTGGAMAPICPALRQTIAVRKAAIDAQIATLTECRAILAAFAPTD